MDISLILLDNSAMNTYVTVAEILVMASEYAKRYPDIPKKNVLDIHFDTMRIFNQLIDAGWTREEIVKAAQSDKNIP